MANPGDDMIITLLLDFGQDVVQLDREQERSNVVHILVDDSILSPIAIVVDGKKSSVVVGSFSWLGTCTVQLRGVVIAVVWFERGASIAAIRWACAVLNNRLVAPLREIHVGV
jgi:hypothetical protein